jgi:hypothetical protein
VQLTVNQLVAGSIPASGAKFGLKVFMDAHEPVTLEEGDRYPLAPPDFAALADVVIAPV